MFQEAAPPCWPAGVSQSTSSSARWTRPEDKLFEQALVRFSDDLPDRWERIAEMVPGKSAEEVLEHYETLVHDVVEIDSGRVELRVTLMTRWSGGTRRVRSLLMVARITIIAAAAVRRPRGRRESRGLKLNTKLLFLVGLKQFGKGDWRSISRNVVVTRTPTQVASHAQKYFLRQSSGKKERKRSSIHDITSVETNSVPAPAERKWIPPPPPPPGDQGGSFGFPDFGFPK
ncbi:putative transcription factor MYB/SANT family [Rosa chinensis]|uniref:Putative transcription factor MYB/SANT family n=1 Tax=Rosa chinensis TaxID=74649 RepID=A0A2P6SD36_ROSCH|nr:putative transcription factor MYB/SANT family [Rosa chinensis]